MLFRSGASVRASELKLSQPGTEILRLASLTLAAAEIDTRKRVATGVEAALKGGRLDLRRDADGRLNLASLRVPATSGKTAEAGAPPSAGEAASSPAPAAAADTGSWAVDLKQVSLEDFSLGLEDAAITPGTRFELAPMEVRVQGLSTRPGVQGSITAKIDRKSTRLNSSH